MSILPMRCSYARRYQGVRVPRCLNGRVCDVCRLKFQQRTKPKDGQKGPKYEFEQQREKRPRAY